MDNFKSDLHAKIDFKMMEISHLICPTWRGAQGPRDITTKIRCTEYVRRKALRHDRHVNVATQHGLLVLRACTYKFTKYSM